MGSGGILSPVTNLLFGGSKGASTGGLGDVASQAQEYASQAHGQVTGLQPQQTAFGQALAEQATGNKTPITEALMKQAQDRTLAQQVAAVRSNRAVNPALAQKQIMRAAADSNQQTAQNAAVAGLQEKNQNQNQFANYLNSIYGAQNGAISAATGANSAMANAQLANDAAADKRTSSMMSFGSGAGAALMMSDKKQKKNIKPVKMANGGSVTKGPVQAGDIAVGEGLNEEDFKKGGGQLADLFQQKPDSAYTLAGGPMDNMGSGMAPSSMPALDPEMLMFASKGAVVPGQAKVKGDSEQNDTVPALLSPGELVIPRSVAKQGPDAIKSFAEALCNGGYAGSKKMSQGGKVEKPLDLDKLQAYEYDYKNPEMPGAGEGKHVSVMAQDLEKAGPVGKSMVMNTPNGKMVDYGKGFGAMLAAQAELNERLKEIEKRYPAKKV